MERRKKIDLLEMIEEGDDLEDGELDAVVDMAGAAFRLCGQIANHNSEAMNAARRNDVMLDTMLNMADLIFAQASGREAIEIK